MRPLRRLPDRPDLDQLRRQARDLQRAAAGGDPVAAARIGGGAARPALSAVQLALAREYGFASWPRLTAEVARRRAGAAAPRPSQEVAAPPSAAAPPARYRIRPAASLEELAVACDVIGAQIVPPLARGDRRLQEVARRFPEDQPLMLVVREPTAPPARAAPLADAGRIVGGALAFRTGPRGVTLRMIGLEPRARGQGVGRRLMAAVELAALRLGAGAISLGAERDVRGFYARLGYAGRGAMLHKGLPLPGRSVEARLRKLAAEGDDDGDDGAP
jgi:GNAT superfamily N-acetyltransferase